MIPVTTMKRDSDAAFGKPDPLLDKSRKVLKRAEDIVDEAMPDELFMQQMSTIDHESTNYVDITILCAIRLASGIPDASIAAIAHRYWNNTSDRLERNALSRFREKSSSTPAVEVVRSWLESTAHKLTITQPTKKTPVPPQVIIIVDDDNDATSAVDQLAGMKKEPELTAQQSTKREPVRNNKHEAVGADDESDSSAADRLVVSKSEHRQQRSNLEHTAKAPNKKKSISTQPAPVYSNKHDPISVEDDTDGTSNDASAGDRLLPLSKRERQAGMPQFPRDNIFDKDRPVENNLICPLMVMNDGKNVLCLADFPDDEALCEHLDEQHDVTYNPHDAKSFGLFTKQAALPLGMPLTRGQLMEYKDIHATQGITAVMTELRIPLPMPTTIKATGSHSSLGDADRILAATQLFYDTTWRAKVLLPEMHTILVQFQPKLERLNPIDLPRQFKQVFHSTHCLLAIKSTDEA